MTMAICSHCEREMMTADGCIFVPVAFKGEFAKPIPYFGEVRCHDCNVLPGQYHHPGCDMEQCPSCGGQLISCGCLAWAEEDSDND